MPLTEPDTNRLTRFYGDITSVDAIVRALSREGVDTGRLQASDLYSRGLDCQNMGSFPVLQRVADAVGNLGGLDASHRVLDVGCGMGGPGRFLADRYGCYVTGTDLLPLRVDTARLLSQMVGMGDRVEYRAADATNLPYGDGAFHEAWLLDSSIHMRDKSDLFREVARVVAGGGLLVLHDQTGPLPKALAPVTRRAPYFAVSLARLVRYVEEAGFRMLTWQDTTDQAREMLIQRRSAAQGDGDAGRSGDRRRMERGKRTVDAYIEALEHPDGRTGFLVARRLG